MKTMERELGFYWVRDKNGWLVAEFRITVISKTKVWLIPGSQYERKDADFFEIDETKLIYQ